MLNQATTGLGQASFFQPSRHAVRLILIPDAARAEKISKTTTYSSRLMSTFTSSLRCVVPL
jgi:hypothetical protein